MASIYNLHLFDANNICSRQMTTDFEWTCEYLMNLLLSKEMQLYLDADNAKRQSEKLI